MIDNCSMNTFSDRNMGYGNTSQNSESFGLGISTMGTARTK